MKTQTKAVFVMLATFAASDPAADAVGPAIREISEPSGELEGGALVYDESEGTRPFDAVVEAMPDRLASIEGDEYDEDEFDEIEKKDKKEKKEKKEKEDDDSKAGKEPKDETPPSSKSDKKPTKKPTSSSKSSKPTKKPTRKPTSSSSSKSSKPTKKPTRKPTKKPTSSSSSKSSKPTKKPTRKPTKKPTSSSSTSKDRCVDDEKPKVKRSGEKYKFKLERSDAECVDDKSRVYSYGQFKKVKEFSKCAEMCVKDVSSSLLENFRGFDWNCKKNRCNCLYDRGTLDSRNTDRFDDYDRNEDGKGKIKKGKKKSDVYCGKLKEVKFVGMDDEFDDEDDEEVEMEERRALRGGI